MKPALLFLVHRVPYPPNKGDKIRSYHLLQYLSPRYRVFLAAFVDAGEDVEHWEALKDVCEEVFLVRLTRNRGRLRSLRGLLDGEPLTLPYYRDASIARWVQERLDKEPDARILVFSSAMAQYVLGERWADRRRVIDFVDVDSDKWRQYAPTQRLPMAWIYRREADTLLDFERQIAAKFDASFFVSAHEAELFRQLAPDHALKIWHVNNGVDLAYYSPSHELASPYPSEECPLVFVGAMDYWPNIDAVEWFARQVLPRLRLAIKALHFYIVGANPTSAVKALARLDGVKVTGRVADIRPYVRHARIVVAPLRIARGVQNKVLEAMAMARPAVVSEAALEGIDAQPGRDVILASEAEGFAQEILDLVAGKIDGDAIGRAARQLVERRYDWERNLAALQGLLEDKRGAPVLKVAANDR